MPTTIAQLQAVITADTSQFSAGMNSAGNKIDEIKRKGNDLKSANQQLGSSFSALGAALTASLTAPIGAMAALGVSFVDMKQKALLAFETMMHSADKAKALFGQLQQFAAATPFDLPGVVANTQRLTAMGFAVKDVIPVMRVLGDAVAGVGGSADTLNRVALALGQIKTNGTLKTQDINQLTDAGLPVWDILSQKMHKSVTQVREDIAKGAVDSVSAVNMILGGLDKRFGGLMGKMGDTWSTTISNLQDSAQQTFGALFEPAIKGVTKFVQSISNGLFKAKAVIEAMPDGFKNLIVALLGVAAAAGPVLLAIGGIISAVSAIAPVVEGVGAVIAGALSAPFLAVAAVVVSAIAAYKANFLGFRDLVNSIGQSMYYGLIWVVSAIQVVGAAAWEWIQKQIKSIEKLLEPVAKVVKGWAATISQGIKDGLGEIDRNSDAHGGLLQQINAKFETNKNSLGQMWDKAKGVVSSFDMNAMPHITGGGAAAGDDKEKKKTPAERQAESFAEELAKTQLTLRLLRKGESQDIADLAGQFPTLALARIKELQAAKDGVKGILDEREARKKLAADIASNYQEMRKKVLLERDGSVENTIAVNTYGKAIGELTAAQRKAIQPTIDLAGEDARHTQIKEAAKQADEAAKKALEERIKATQDAVNAVRDAHNAYLESIASTDAEKVALKQFHAELKDLPFTLQIASAAIAQWNKATADNEAIKKRTEEIAKLRAEYQALISGNTLDLFITQQGGKPAELTPEQRKSFSDLFDATQQRDQAKHIGDMQSDLQKMASGYLKVSGATEEARLAMKYFGADISTLAPEVQAKIRQMAPDFDALEKYQKFRDQAKKAGEEIKSVFQDAFTAVLNRSGNFFTSLINGFKQMLVRIVAEWAANKVANAIISLWDKEHQGLAEDAARAAKNMVTGAAAIGIAAALLDKAAKDTKSAATAMAVSAGASAIAGASGAGAAAGGMSLAGAGGAAGGASIFGSGFAHTMPYVAAAEAIDQLFFHGQGTKWLGNTIGGAIKGIGKIFHFASGSWSVPGAGSGDSVPAMLTPGEMVVSKPFAQGIRENGGMFGGDVHLAAGGTVVINDKADVARIQATVRARRQSKFTLMGA